MIVKKVDMYKNTNYFPVKAFSGRSTHIHMLSTNKATPLPRTQMNMDVYLSSSNDPDPFMIL
jgi:hypothetical protein